MAALTGQGNPEHACYAAAMTFIDHIRACNTAVLPGGRVQLVVGDAAVGWMMPDIAARVRALGGVGDDPVRVDPAALPDIGRALADAGVAAWRNEAFDVRADPDGLVLATIDRGLLPALGLRAVGAHLNGLVHRVDGPWLWVARRSATKLLDPGKLDNIAAGGVAAGSTPWATLLKEAEEEAGLPPSLTGTARAAGWLDYAMDRPEGLRRDRLYVYDLDLPESFIPEARDGEVEAFELWPMPEVLARVRDGDAFKFNVNLVLIDLFLRLGMVAEAEARALQQALGRDRL